MACEFAEVLNGCGCVTGYNIPLMTIAEIPISSYPVGVKNVNGVDIDGTGITPTGIATSPSEYVKIWNSDAADQARGKLFVGSGAYCFYFVRKSGQVVPSSVLGSGILLNDDGTPILTDDGHYILT